MGFEAILMIFIICEIFELFYVQKGSSVSEYIANMSLLYKRGVILFLCFHPSFYIAVFTAMVFNVYSVLSLSLIVFKAFDIALKLILLGKIENRQSLGVFERMLQNDMKLSFFMKAIASAFYIAVFYLSFSSYT
jgi:hypothetical protein